jgi:hypothetical protein
MFEKEKEKYVKDKNKDSDVRFKKIEEEYNHLKNEVNRIDTEL